MTFWEWALFAYLLPAGLLAVASWPRLPDAHRDAVIPTVVGAVRPAYITILVIGALWPLVLPQWAWMRLRSRTAR